MGIKSYRELEVWQKAMDLVVACYDVTRQFPRQEIYGLTSQLQRAAVSVPANIAEGQGRQHRSEFLQFLSIAHGSLVELETHIQIAQRIGYLSESDTHTLLKSSACVGRLINGLRRSLRPPATPATNNHQPTADQ